MPSEKQQAAVFYSWQSDLPNSTNRGFIQDALERAAKAIRADDSLSIEPVVDRDTQNVPGSPDIAHTIFQKIDEAAAFVADVSIINNDGRPTPNPNVLIELGYALKSLGNLRVVLVFNLATGEIENLPFDLRTKRVLSYNLSEGGEDKPEQRKKLKEILESSLRTVLAQEPRSAPKPTVFEKAIQSIEVGSPSQTALCARVVPAIATKLAELNPNLVREEQNEWDQKLVNAISETLSDAREFARVAQAAAMHGSRNAALGLFRGFDKLFIQYRLPYGVGGSYFEEQFDLPRFVGHELMVILFSALIAENQWDTVRDLCNETVFVQNAERNSPEDAHVTYNYASQPIVMLYNRSRKTRRVSAHADLLQERHGSGEMAELSPLRQFQEADVFLTLRSIALGLDAWHSWHPWSAIFLQLCPSYWTAAVSRSKATSLMGALGLSSLDELRSALKSGAEALREVFNSQYHMYHPFKVPDLNAIGSRA